MAAEQPSAWSVLRDLVAPPRTRLESELVQIWEELLGVAPIGIEDSFFEAGGHSLLAVRLMAQIRTRLGRDLPRH